MTDTDAKLIERLRKAADQAGIVLTDPPGPTPLKALLDEAATRLSAVIAERDKLASRVSDLEIALNYATGVIAPLSDPSVVRVNILAGKIAIPDDLVWLHDTNGPVAAIRADLDEMRKALEPFAEANAELFNDWCPDETPAWYYSNDGFDAPSPVTVGDFRRAARLLKQGETP